ncbi:MAG: MFS transporter [Verrucomicrobia bacterium]|nr:MFS transporter [Verrucomicrobiota bacterium]
MKATTNLDSASVGSQTRPTRVRYRVVGLTVLLAMVTYLDRVCISKLAPEIMRDLGLSMIQMSYVFSAFALAYALFEIPTAWWADRFGTRAVLTRIVVWWSAFTIATAGAFNYGTMLVTRFLFGAGEAGAWPCVARTFSRWIPRSERGTIQGIFFAGAHLAGGVTPLVVVALMPYMHWRMIFVLFGALGFVWAAAWYVWFRDDPSQHKAVNGAELERITAERPADATHEVGWEYWRRLFRNRNVIALCIMYVPNSSMFYFCITWLPTYLKERHGFDAALLGFLSGLPLLLSVVSDLFGGVVTDRVAARYGLRAGRCLVGGVAYVIAAVSLIVAAASPVPVLAAVLISVATAACMFTLGAAWGTCIEVGRDHAGVVSAAMNTAGQLGSLICPLVVGYAVQWFESWNLPLYLMGLLFLIGTFCWLIIDPREPVFAEKAE